MGLQKYRANAAFCLSGPNFVSNLESELMA